MLFKYMYVPTFCDGVANIVKPDVPIVRLRSNDIGIRMQAQHFKTETYKLYFTNRIVYLGTLYLLILDQRTHFILLIHS